MEPLSSENASEVQSFLDWFKSRPGTTLNSKVALRDIHDAGRGLVAIGSIDEDEELFRIPRNLVLDGQTTSLRQCLADRIDALDPWMSLILVVIFEALRGKKSTWHPYITLLPNNFDTLMFWSREELRELQASAVVQKIGRKSAEERFSTEIIPIVREYPDLFPIEQKKLEDEVIRLAHIAGSCVMAYAFDIEADDQGKDDESLVTDNDENLPKGMVPFADMLNADAARNNAHLSQEEDCFIMKATKRINLGEEIFNTYGELPRSDLLRRYGYIADSYKPYDIVEISLELVSDASNAQGMTRKEIQKALAPLDEIGTLEDGYILERTESNKIKDIIPTELLMVVKAICKEARKKETVGSSVSRIDGLYPSEISFLHIILTNRIAEYTTTLEDDLTLLQSLSSNSDARDRRLRMAVEVRIGEKEILQYAKQVTEACIATKTEEIAAESKKRRASVGSENPKSKDGKALKTK